MHSINPDARVSANGSETWGAYVGLDMAARILEQMLQRCVKQVRQQRQPGFCGRRRSVIHPPVTVSTGREGEGERSGEGREGEREVVRTRGGHRTLRREWLLCVPGRGRMVVDIVGNQEETRRNQIATRTKQGKLAKKYEASDNADRRKPNSRREQLGTFTTR